MSDYRKFPVAVQLAIQMRATDASGRIHCEGCGIWLKRRKDYEIDHVIAEHKRPLADRQKPPTAADGQLLCVAVCHPKKTKGDVGDIAQAKRREAAAHGIEPPSKKKLKHKKKDERPPYKPARGEPEVTRRYK